MRLHTLMNKRLLAGILAILVLIAVVVFFLWKKPEIQVSETGSNSILPVSEDDILIQNPAYYLSKAQPYFQDLEVSVEKKDYDAAVLVNKKIYGYLVKMKQVSVIDYAQDQVQFLINGSEDLKEALLVKNEANIEKALSVLRMMKVLQFQTQRQEIGKN